MCLRFRSKCGERTEGRDAKWNSMPVTGNRRIRQRGNHSLPRSDSIYLRDTSEITYATIPLTRTILPSIVRLRLREILRFIDFAPIVSPFPPRLAKNVQLRRQLLCFPLRSRSRPTRRVYERVYRRLERLVARLGIFSIDFRRVTGNRDTDVALRQIWQREARRKLQLIYEGGTLTDCIDEELPGGEESDCLSSASPDDYGEGDEDDVELFDLGDEDASRMPRELSWLSSTSELRHRCYHVRTRARNQIMAQHRRRDYTKLANSTSSGRKQRRGRNRARRELLMVPGTQWCGRGHRATKYTNLGGFGVADACCRRHDTACPFSIPAFESRYGVFNWGISTIMHCGCDERFRTCLKMAGTSSANFIGKIFFNVLQTKCFVLKPQKTCVKRTWMGKCQRHEYRKVAHIRDNVPY